MTETEEISRLTKYTEIFHLVMLCTYLAPAISMMGCGLLVTIEYYYSGFPTSNLTQTKEIFVIVAFTVDDYHYVSIYLKLDGHLQLYSFLISPILIFGSSVFPMTQIIVGILFYTTTVKSMYVVWGIVSFVFGLTNFIFIIGIFIIKLGLYKIGVYQNKF
eukprot:gene12073-5566_t